MTVFLHYSLPIYLLQLLVALVTVFLAAGRFSQSSGGGLAKFISHPRRAWLALAIFFLTRIAVHLFWFWRISHPDRLHLNQEFLFVIGILINVIQGAVFGLVGCFLSVCGDRLIRSYAFGVASGFLVLWAVVGTMFSSLRLNTGFYAADILTTLALAVFVCARANPVAANDAEGKKSPVTFALVLAFFPSVLLLLMWTILAGGGSRTAQPAAAVFIVCCIISVVCCFAASFMLFRRRTGLAIFGGILFMLLNAFVSFLFGCGALLTGMKF